MALRIADASFVASIVGSALLHDCSLFVFDFLCGLNALCV